jgi:hypothetical protein
LDEFIEKQQIRKNIMDEMMENQPSFDHYLDKIKNNNEMMFPSVVSRQVVGSNPQTTSKVMAGSQTNLANSFNGLYESDNAGQKNFYTMAMGSQKN